ncbi:hypothetical protein JCM19240_2429 [Vibrio maritimus]|uniref:Uncharacterized protein n=1 Tax=Vibrio maritimus TaxID=990268 RepID=A0A090T3F4_9VIBR|nr:hypothetical protein JCM19240_2429 [Vibrio maritimus]
MRFWRGCIFLPLTFGSHFFLKFQAVNLSKGGETTVALFSVAIFSIEPANKLLPIPTAIQYLQSEWACETSR